MNLPFVPGIFLFANFRIHFFPLSISLNNNITFGQAPDLFYYKKISSSDFIDVEQFYSAKDFTIAGLMSASRLVLSPVVELLVKKANGSMPAAETDAAINAFRNNVTRNDLNKYAGRTNIFPTN